jgi:hypothetical protein
LDYSWQIETQGLTLITTPNDNLNPADRLKAEGFKNEDLDPYRSLKASHGVKESKR